MVNFAAGLTALLSGVAFAPQAPGLQPQVNVAHEGSVTMIRISLDEMVTARAAPLAGPVEGAWRSADVNFGDAFSPQSGVHTVAVASGLGSTAQAASSINMTVRIDQGF